MTASHSITFKTVDLDGTDSSAWKPWVDKFKNTPGIQRVFYGPVVEDPHKGVVAALGASAPSIQGDGLLPFDFRGSPSAILEAPATEIFRAYGAHSGFYDKAVQFVAKVDADPPQKGYFGSAAGKSADGDTVAVLLGWESREAHLEAKSAPGSSIAANIELIRSGRKSVDMVHVTFKEQ